MYFGTVSYITVVLYFELIAGDVTSDPKNATDVKNSTLIGSDVKIPVKADGQKVSNQRRRGMESEMAYPQGYFPPFGGDFQPSTTPYNHVPMRRESVPIIIERTVSSQPAIINTNPMHRRIASNVYNPTQSGHQQVYYTNLANGYQIPGQGVYKPQETFSDTSYIQKPLFQQPEYQNYPTYQDTSRYQPQIYQVASVANRYPSVSNYNPQTAVHNQYGPQNDGGYSMDQPLDNARILQRELQTLRELEEQHRRLLQQINARAQGVLYYNSDSSLTRKVITQYPNDQSTTQFSSQPSYPNEDSQSTIVIMDPASPGVTSGNPYTHQIRVSRHPGQMPSPASVHTSKRGMEAVKTKAGMKMVGKAQMTVPVVIGLEVSPSDQSNVWKYFELKSTERIRSIYQANPRKPLVPYPDLLPPCPGGFLCDDMVKPATKNYKNHHVTKNPKTDEQDAPKNVGNEKGKTESNERDASTQGSKDTDDETQPQSTQGKPTENPAIVMPDSADHEIPEKDVTENVIFFGSDNSEEPEADDDPTINGLDPRASAADPEPHEPKADGIVYKLGE